VQEMGRKYKLPSCYPTPTIVISHLETKELRAMEKDPQPQMAAKGEENMLYPQMYVKVNKTTSCRLQVGGRVPQRGPQPPPKWDISLRHETPSPQATCNLYRN
jgi:hypothetical protein